LQIALLSRRIAFRNAAKRVAINYLNTIRMTQLPRIQESPGFGQGFLRPRFELQSDKHRTPSMACHTQYVYFVDETTKDMLLKELLKDAESGAVVYVKTNFAADNVAEQLTRAGIPAEAVHDNKSRRTSEKSYDHFMAGKTKVLVSTDSAGCKINVEGISLIINYDLPVSAETYMQRVKHERGLTRTVSFCTNEEKGNLKNINRVLAEQIAIVAHELSH
jgi:superfamily II DNA/RNA helicase